MYVMRSVRRCENPVVLRKVVQYFFCFSHVIVPHQRILRAALVKSIMERNFRFKNLFDLVAESFEIITFIDTDFLLQRKQLIFNLIVVTFILGRSNQLRDILVKGSRIFEILTGYPFREFFIIIVGKPETPVVSRGGLLSAIFCRVFEYLTLTYQGYRHRAKILVLHFDIRLKPSTVKYLSAIPCLELRPQRISK